MNEQQQQHPAIPPYLITQMIQKRQPSKQITQKIIYQIYQGKLQIPSEIKPFARKSRVVSEKSLQNSRLDLINQLRSSKQKTLRQLQQLKKRQLQIKLNARASNSNTKKEKSMFTQQEKNKIKQILKQTKIQQIKKKRQHQQILQYHTNILKKERQQQQELIEKLRYQHKKQVEHNLINIQLRKKKRQQSFKEVSLRMLQLKKRKYIHLAKQKQDKQLQQVSQSITKQKINQIKQRMKLDIQDIKKHQKMYKQFQQQKSLERIERLKTQIKNSSTSRRYEETCFSRILQNQQKQKIKQRLRKQNNAKQMRMKVNQFKQYVRQNYRPARRATQNSTSNQKQRKTVKSFSHKQIIDQGNKNLQLARKLRKQKDDPRVITQPQVVKYIDYLKTMRKKSNRGNLQKFKSMIKSQQTLDYETAQKAKHLVDQMEAKSKKVTNSKLFEAIQNKIDLLKVLL